MIYFHPNMFYAVPLAWPAQLAKHVPPNCVAWVQFSNHKPCKLILICCLFSPFYRGFLLGCLFFSLSLLRTFLLPNSNLRSELYKFVSEKIIIDKFINSLTDSQGTRDLRSRQACHRTPTLEFHACTYIVFTVCCNRSTHNTTVLYLLATK